MKVIALDGIKLLRCADEDAFELRVDDAGKTRRIRFLVDSKITNAPGEEPPPEAGPMAEFMGRVVAAIEGA